MVTEKFWNTANKIFSTFFEQIWPKNINSLFKMKFGIKTNLNMLNPMVMSKFSVLDQNYLFWENLVHKIKIVCLRWNLASTIIYIIFWDYLMFYPIFLHHEWSDTRLFLINMVFTICLTCCRMTWALGS